jgi:hypothetical protein
VFGVVLSETGEKIGNEFQISDPSMRDCYGSQITLLADGRVFVSWTTEDGMGDFSGTSVQGRYYFENPYVKSVHAAAGSPLQSQNAPDYSSHSPVFDSHLDHTDVRRDGVHTLISQASADAFVFESVDPVRADAGIAFAAAYNASQKGTPFGHSTGGPDRITAPHAADVQDRRSSHADHGEGPWAESDAAATFFAAQSLHASIAADYFLMV